MKQTIQQTAVQRAVQPVARPIPSGFERFVTEDDSEELQRQINENEELLEDAKNNNKLSGEDTFAYTKLLIEWLGIIKL